ncbi:hypothetical protein CPB83DRAFT_898202 [Crepidotus variabilis]|uniref:T6SS Phospholipase effector Tle1-like catalytic domain-containing protein n=1 Tax=Crepidotus variabilis TaxID=179855 RepID=A0A9P6E7S5_9AGAR|nr:hypothetical protein CPB83DRAFT_898202 [Crepidotus variabilis]
MPCGHFRNGRNLVINIDGTSNQFGDKNTNVIELYNLILKDTNDNQQTFYNSGIGTYAEPSWKLLAYYKQVLYHQIDLAIAWDFERTVKAAYKWLSDNYQDGDCIFLFGFSRGAFQVRVVAAMIHKVGLLYKGNDGAYALYCASEQGKSMATQVGSQQEISMSERFKKAFSRKDVKVHFVGAWDTVSSIGIMRGKRMLPATTDGMNHVCYFRHALALDERRVKFQPEFAYGGSTKPPITAENGKTHNSPYSGPAEANDTAGDTTNENDNDSLPPRAARKKVRPRTLEVWFAGTHSDIGGGNVFNASMDRSWPPLRWMVFEAEAVGLRMAKFEREVRPEEQIEIQESLTGFWWLLEMFPIRRLSFSWDRLNHSTYKPHFGACRKIHDGQKIHSSLLLADAANAAEYTPRLVLQLDLYEGAHHAVNMFLNGQGVMLREIATSNEGGQAIYDGLLTALKSETLSPDEKHSLMNVALELFGGIHSNKYSLILESFSQVHRFVLLDAQKERSDTTRLFLNSLTDCHLPSHTTRTRAHCQLRRLLTGWKYIASGSDDCTIRLWNAATGNPIGEPFRGHSDYVRSVVFSANGKLLVSGSDDKTVRIWNVETGAQVGKPFEGHTEWVLCVAFSPRQEDKLVVSGSSGDTIRIWNVNMGEVVGEPLHDSLVYSVAFSPDGQYIASGSDDETIRLWDVETRSQVGQPLQAHSQRVSDVAFLPDGRRIVSASWDGTIRRWDVKMQEQIGKAITGHATGIYAVAISPNGKHIVSVKGLETQELKGLFTDSRQDDQSPPPPVPSRPKKERMACGHYRNGRNLIVCIDGTANKSGMKDEQQTFYNSGIGTYAEPSWKSLTHLINVIYHVADLAIAWDFDKKVQVAYKWLCDNYQDGDCIFLFGFSRGAFQVGLLYKGNDAQIPFAYDAYRKSEGKAATAAQLGSSDPEEKMAARFKQAFSREDVKVHFVGAWDTVSSIGIGRSKNMLPATIDGMGHVCYFRHALALDERWVPEFAYGGSTKNPIVKEDNEKQPSPKHNAVGTDEIADADAFNENGASSSAQRATREKVQNHPHTLDVWFAGTHSDIGGGNALNPSMDRT